MGPVTVERRGVALLLLGAAAAIFAVFVALTSGIDTRIAGVAVRSRSWERPAVVAALLAASGLFSLRHALPAFLPAAAQALRFGLLGWTLFASLWFGTYAAGGADSYGYLSQARLLAEGRLTDTLPEHAAFDWPEVRVTLTPLGYTRGGESDVLVPVYPPGFPMMMAALALIHRDAMFLVVPLCAALTVWLCIVLGRELDSPGAGLAGALLLSVSPTFLLQMMQPMSDVPVTALWLSALLLTRSSRPVAPILAGLVTSLAILVRPNLAPLATLIAAGCALRPPSGEPRFLSRPLRRAALCVLAMLPGLVTLGVIQAIRYGSPVASGYGSVGELFGLSNIRPNLSRYPRWLTEAHTPLIWLSLASPLALLKAARRIVAFGWLLFVFAAAVGIAYLPYVPFQSHEWSYTRFLLPALPLMMVLAALVLLRALRSLVPRAAVAVVAVICVLVGVVSLYRAVDLAVFRMWEGERKYPRVGEFVRERLPSSAFVLAAQHSGSLRYYSDRPTLRWDLLDRASLDRAISSLRNAGYDPFLVVDVGEDEAFLRRFRGTGQRAVSALAPLATIGNTTVYVFR